MLKELAFSTKSDVWSFGVVLFELATDGSMPFVEIDSIRVKELVLAGGHVTMPATHIALRNTAFNCFKKSPSARPSFVQLETLLHKAKEGACSTLRGGEVQRTPDLAPLDDMLDAEAAPVAETAPRPPSPTHYMRLKSPGNADHSSAALPLDALNLASPRSTSSSGPEKKPLSAAKPTPSAKKSSTRRSTSQSVTGPLPIYGTTLPRHGRGHGAATVEDKSKLNPRASREAPAGEAAPVSRRSGGDGTDAASAARSFVV